MNTKITRARTQLLLKSPFFGTLALRLRIVEGGTDTMATDGSNLYYSEKFVNELNEAELTGVICHEILHCALKHIWRKGDRIHKKWNAACDYAINAMLLESFNYILPKDRLYNPDWSGKSAEEIYNLIPDNAKAPAWGAMIIGVRTDGDGESPEGAKELSAADTQALEIEWDIALKQAVAASKTAGNIPGCLSKLVTQAEATVRWEEQLVRLIGGISKSDFSWMKPDPIYLHSNMVIPTLNAPSIGHLTFAIDTSGSCTIKMLARFLAEFQSVLNSVHFTGLTVIHCDTQINKIEELERDDEIAAEVFGRGGTCFQPVFDYIKDNPTDGLIYFTDMQPSYWPKEPGIPVFWARTTSTSAPYGEHINLYADY